MCGPTGATRARSQDRQPLPARRGGARRPALANGAAPRPAPRPRRSLRATRERRQDGVVGRRVRVGALHGRRVAPSFRQTTFIAGHPHSKITGKRTASFTGWSPEDSDVTGHPDREDDSPRPLTVPRNAGRTDFLEKVAPWLAVPKLTAGERRTNERRAKYFRLAGPALKPLAPPGRRRPCLACMDRRENCVRSCRAGHTPGHIRKPSPSFPFSSYPCSADRRSSRGRSPQGPRSGVVGRVAVAGEWR